MKRILARIAALALCAAMALPTCATAYAAPAGDGDQARGTAWICGKQEHRHGVGCWAPPVLDSFLREKGLADYGRKVFLIHQHDGYCYGRDGSLICPLANSGYLAAYPNVIAIHQHDGNCHGDCGVKETLYCIDGGDGTYSGPSAPNGDRESDSGDMDVDEGTFLVGTPGGVKDTGENQAGEQDGRPVYVVRFHHHGQDCDGVCDEPEVLPFSMETSMYRGMAVELGCGKEEHAHGSGCVAGQRGSGFEAEPDNGVYVGYIESEPMMVDQTYAPTMAKAKMVTEYVLDAVGSMFGISTFSMSSTNTRANTVTVTFTESACGLDPNRKMENPDWIGELEDPEGSSKYIKVNDRYWTNFLKPAGLSQTVSLDTSKLYVENNYYRAYTGDAIVSPENDWGKDGPNTVILHDKSVFKVDSRNPEPLYGLPEFWIRFGFTVPDGDRPLITDGKYQSLLDGKTIENGDEYITVEAIPVGNAEYRTSPGGAIQSVPLNNVTGRQEIGTFAKCPTDVKKAPDGSNGFREKGVWRDIVDRSIGWYELTIHYDIIITRTGSGSLSADNFDIRSAVCTPTTMQLWKDDTHTPPALEHQPEAGLAKTAIAGEPGEFTVVKEFRNLDSLWKQLDMNMFGMTCRVGNQRSVTLDFDNSQEGSQLVWLFSEEEENHDLSDLDLPATLSWVIGTYRLNLDYGDRTKSVSHDFVVRLNDDQSVRKFDFKGDMSVLAPEQAGSKFLGWYEDEEFTKPAKLDRNNAVYQIDSNVFEQTLYAKWEQMGGAELPKTGGEGVWAYVGIGIVLLGVGAMGVLYAKGRRED